MRSWIRLRTVYPRWRGEHPAGMCRVQLDAGLSPLARGTLVRLMQGILSERFIPAGAGNTRWRRRRQILQTVYPRWRGEHKSGGILNKPDDGLSPLARGTQFHACPARAGVRFIPAGAGNTPGFGMKSRSGPVYPRWRGEHPLIPCNPGGPHGLSPLARGTLSPRRKSALLKRFIPAGAGNTLKIYYCFIIAF